MKPIEANSLLEHYKTTHDPLTFNSLFKGCFKMVYSSAYKILKNNHDSEEVAQNCFVEMYKHPEKITSSVFGWVTITSMNMSKTLIRGRERRKNWEFGYEKDLGVPSYAFNKMADAVDTSIEKLDDADKFILKRFFFDNCVQKDIAAELGVSQETVSRRINMAVIRIRRLLSQLEDLEDSPTI